MLYDVPYIQIKLLYLAIQFKFGVSREGQGLYTGDKRSSNDAT